MDQNDIIDSDLTNELNSLSPSTLRVIYALGSIAFVFGIVVIINCIYLFINSITQFFSSFGFNGNDSFRYYFYFQSFSYIVKFIINIFLAINLLGLSSTITRFKNNNFQSNSLEKITGTIKNILLLAALLFLVGLLFMLGGSLVTRLF